MGGLRELAESDLALTLESEADWGWPVKVTDPAGFSANLFGSSGDIALLIDPDTGIPISGRQVHFDLRMSTILAKGFPGMPAGVPETDRKPWILEFDSIIAETIRMRVIDAKPDRTLGIVKLLLGRFE